MRKLLKSFAILLFAVFSCFGAFAQSGIVKGKIENNSTGDAVPAVSVTVKGSGAGTYSDDKGNFSLSVNQKFPITIVVSSIGYEQQTISVKSESDFVSVRLQPVSTLGPGSGGVCNPHAIQDPWNRRLLLKESVPQTSGVRRLFLIMT